MRRLCAVLLACLLPVGLIPAAAGAAAGHPAHHAAAKKKTKAKKKKATKKHAKVKAKKKKVVKKTSAAKTTKPATTTTSGTTTSTGTKPSPSRPASSGPASSFAVTTDAAPPIDAPAKNTMLWGVWNDRHLTGTLTPWDMSSTNVFESSVNKRESLVQFGVPMIGTTGAYYTFPTPQLQAIRDHGSIPVLAWSTMKSGDYSNPDTTLRAINAGRHDDGIRAFAQAAAAWGKPFFLRFNWEMNGDWFPWGASRGDNSSAQFVKAWRRVHDIFAAAGATNVTWVWCPVADPYHVEPDIAALYPGDAYVDWTGIDGYNTNKPWRSFSTTMGSTYDQIQSIAPSKPMMVGETGSTEVGGNKAAWISDMFDALPRRFPKIRALLWWNQAGNAPYVDMPLDTSRAATQAFADGVSPSSFKGNTYAGFGDSPITAP
jgi:hypothetical protein